MLDVLLMVLSEKVISEDDFFQEEISKNFLTLNNLVKKKYINLKNSPLESNVYLEETNKRISSLKNKLRKNEYSIEKLKVLKNLVENPPEEFNLKDRVNLICFKNKEESNTLYYSIVDTIEECNNMEEKIDKIITHLKLYFPNDEKENIYYYEDIKRNMYENQINAFLDMKKSENFKNLLELINKISDWELSALFKVVFLKCKENHQTTEDDQAILNETKKILNALLCNEDLFCLDLTMLNNIMKIINIANLENE
eukprot:jgi/Orpsp1_1/1184166/evm.model.c7180000088273.1